jgi:hypothetical protein
MKREDRLNVLLAHYDALPILIDYIKRKVQVDIEAQKTLDRWDKERNK